MRLTDQQVQTILKTPNNADKVYFAAKQEKRLRFHCDPVQDKSKLNQAFTLWMEWVKSILPADKMERFQSLVTLPVPTNKLAASIFTELRKVFDSQNGAKKLQFIDPSLSQDFSLFDQQHRLSSWMSEKGWEAIRLNISSFVVVDLPAAQTTPRPEPYVLFVEACTVYDCQYNEDERLDYLFYHNNITGNDGKQIQQMVCLCDEFYRVMVKDEQSGEWLQSLRIAHSTFDANSKVIDGPGYTPASGVWKTGSKSSNYIDKVGPITNVLGDLDYYLFKEISFKYLGLYGDYPIMFTFKTVCDYKNDQGAMCEGGRVAREVVTADPSQPTTIYEECPACNSRKRIGPGTVGTITAPKDEQDVNLMEKPIHIAEVSTELLTYGGDLLDDLEEDLFNTCVGIDTNEAVAMAQNEKQVQKSFESKENVLLRIAANIDYVEKFIYDTVCYLRYGRRYYLGSTINSGTDFYLQNLSDLDSRYNDAKTAGKPMYELANLRDIANKTQNRNNPEALMRNHILDQLEPWVDLSLTNIVALGLQNTDMVNFVVKVNFNSYIDRFERENINIVDFGSLIDFSQKIKIITEKLQQYGKETIASAQPNPAADAGPTGPTGKR